MKTFSRGLENLSQWCTAACLLCLAGAANGATFSVSPSTISNTYTGVITLQIDGLTNGEDVRIGRYLDANTNGVVDTGDFLVQAFRLIDGRGKPVIDGVTNINVPGDSTPTNGAITTELNLSISGVAQLIVGQYAFRLVSPTGRFTPITNLFNVTNSAYAQSVTGNVVCSGTNVPNAVVLLFRGPVMNSNPRGGAVADGSGGYTIEAPAGTCGLAAFKSNYVSDVTTAPVFTLETNATVITNVSLVPATRSISGRFVDAANSNSFLPGVLVLCESTNRQLAAIGFTDTNGNFTVPVTSGQWRVSWDELALGVLGYLGFQERPLVDTSTGSVSGVTIAFPRGTALLYGSVKDDQNYPLAGVLIYPYEDGGQYESAAMTDQNGNYVAAVVAGTWSGDLGRSSAANYVFTSGQGGTAISNGQAVRMDFVGILATNHITGYVRDAVTAKGIPGVGVNAWANLNGTNFQQHTETDANGLYSLNVANGSWSVGVNCSGGDDGLESHGYQCVGEQAVVISNGNAAANFAVYPVGAVFLTQPMWLGNGEFQFTFNTTAGVDYTIQYSTTLTNWVSVLAFNGSGGPVTVIDPTAASSSQRFYRVKIGL